MLLSWYVVSKVIKWGWGWWFRWFNILIFCLNFVFILYWEKMVVLEIIICRLVIFGVLLVGGKRLVLLVLLVECVFKCLMVKMLLDIILMRVVISFLLVCDFKCWWEKGVLYGFWVGWSCDDGGGFLFLKFSCGYF